MVGQIAKQPWLGVSIDYTTSALPVSPGVAFHPNFTRSNFVRTRIKQSMGWLTALALVIALAPAVRAQQTPALTISIASTNEIIGDIQYITKIAGQADAGGFVAFMAQQYTQHLDTGKPAGVVVNFNGPEPVVTGFIPVKNLANLLQMVEQQVGKAEDVGNGVKKIGLDQPVFFKEDGAWVFLSNSIAGTATIANPDAAIADLVSKYDIGVRANFRAVPEPLRQMALKEMQGAFERQMEMQAAQSGDPAAAEAQRKMSERAMEQMVRAFEEIDEIVFGLAIDQANKNVHLDLSLTAIEGTKLAKQIAAMESITSNFSGFSQPNAAAVMNVASVLTEDDIQQTNDWLAVVEKQAADEIEKDDNLNDDNAKVAVKKVLSSLMGVVKKTIASGKMDGGAVLTLDNGVAFAAGGYIADGKDVEAAFKELVELAKNEPDFPEVKFNAGTHAGVTFHTLSMTIPEGEEARQALGDKIEVVLGTGEKSAFIGFGNSAMDLIKKVIDDSAAAGAKKVNPTEITISLGPILAFAAKMDPDNAQLKAVAAAVEEGRDRISVLVKTIPRGVSYEIKVDEGVIELGAKAAFGLQGIEDDGF